MKEYVSWQSTNLADMQATDLCVPTNYGHSGVHPAARWDEHRHVLG